MPLAGPMDGICPHPFYLLMHNLTHPLLLSACQYDAAGGRFLSRRFSARRSRTRYVLIEHSARPGLRHLRAAFARRCSPRLTLTHAHLGLGLRRPIVFEGRIKRTGCDNLCQPACPTGCYMQNGAARGRPHRVSLVHLVHLRVMLFLRVEALEIPWLTAMQVRVLPRALRHASY